jgi:uncharacterized protein
MSGDPDPDRAARPALGAAARIADELGLEPLTHEGGWFRRTYADVHGSAIYYLLGPDDASALHRLPSVEVWHHYAGAPARLLTLGAQGAVEHRLGPEILEGQRPQVVVPGGVWQGAISTGEWSLLGTTMAPPYEQAGFELGDPDELRARYPEAAPLIVELARRSAHLY